MKLREFLERTGWFVVGANRWLGVLGVVLTGAALPVGCNQSLFDNYGGGGSDSPPIRSSCADPCIADAAADFNGTAGGVGNRWRYLDDHRNRTWVPMTMGADGMTGADGNRITSCKSSSGSACTALPGALLITSSGATSAADPAIEFKVQAPQVIEITLRVYVPGDADQEFELYRNSREDVLYKGVAAIGKTVEQTIVLDALANDRFLLALIPQAQGAANVGVQLFASGTGAAFPQSCQLALEFDGVSGTSTKDLCKSASFDSITYPGNPTPISLAPGPFMEMGKGVDLPPGATSDNGRFLQGTQVLDQSQDLTVQLWMLQHNQDTTGPAFPFSDLDLSSTGTGGGLGMSVRLLPPVIPTLDVTTADGYIDVAATIGGQDVWQFVRVVHVGSALRVCLNGKRVASIGVAVGQLKTPFPPYIGKNVTWSPYGAYFDGVIDDVRVFTGALPCQ